MKTRETIYRQIEGLWENAVALSTSALVLWTLFQICCLTLGDIAVHLALLNGAWQRDIAEHCVQQVSKCQRVNRTSTSFAGTRLLTRALGAWCAA